jgi:hypothetical protein
MNFLAKDIPTLVFQILPGFVAASIFYTLTAHPKTSEFERVIQALIFTVLLKVVLIPVREFFLLVGRCVGAVSPWNAEAELAWMIVLALPLGLSFVWVMNKDTCHCWARKLKLTGRTSYPSEWYAAFTREGREKRWIILTLDGEQRLYGWPEEWPDQADKGHFVIDQPEWVMPDGSRVPILQTSKFMMPASEVKRVEFLAQVTEVPQSEQEQRQIQEPLINLHRSESNGSQGTTTSTEPVAS